MKQALSFVAGVALVATAPAAASLSEAERISEVLKIQPGQVVADIGAGDGDWSIGLARRVGPTGHVYATEIDPSEIKKIKKALSASDLENVTPVLGTAKNVGLETESCDAILVRVVYHHFSDPPAMRSELLRVLKPGGLIALIDFPPDKPGGGHGVRAETVISDVESAGLQLVEHIENWSGHGRRYLLLFSKPE